tara:strand:- start:29100 stop:30380 length:1281 start_codon:yes stop_codon:yes gene_type:complete
VAVCAALIITGSAALAESANQNKTAEPAERLTAEGLAARVLEANPGLVAIEAAAEAAAYRVDPAGSLDDPMLSYGVAPLTADADRSLNQRVDFNQKIPWPGTLAARESAARYDALAAERDVDALRLRVIAQAKAAYAEWYFVHAALDIHHATQALLDELIATAETRYAAGRALKQDVLQAEVERTDLDNQLLRLLRLKATVQARINALLNQPPNAPLPPAHVIPNAIDLPAFESMQGLALSRHPELAQLEARISASVSRITLAEKAFYPDFQVGVGYNSLWDNADKRPIFGVSINVPLDRSKRRSDLGRAQAEKRRAEWTLIERRAELLADLTQTRAEVVEAQSSVALFRDQLVPLSAEYLEAAIADYQSGSGAFLNVITAEQRALSTELALARARADYARRLAELERWVGGAFDAAAILTSGEQQ